MRLNCVLFLAFVSCLAGLRAATPVEGRVVAVMPEARALQVEVVKAEGDAISAGETLEFRVGTGDLEIGYKDRLIRASAVHYGNAWHLEKVFPLDGVGDKAMADLNERLKRDTASMPRRQYVKVGDYVPNFAMIDQNGAFRQIRSLRGKAFVLNFIFTRCAVPEMCPASTMRMADAQQAAREAGLEDLNFVTITFDPEFDSPGMLRQYARGYDIELDNFHLLTGSQQVVDDLLRQFGIRTREEDGTINHTMATLLVDPNGRVAYRKEGSTWKVEDFIKEANKILKPDNGK